MKIAVTSQDRKTVTGHAGRCRKFWIFEIEDNQIVDKTLIELPKEQSFHESPPHEPHPLDPVSVIITADLCDGLKRRLEWRHIKGIVTTEENPDTAVSLYLAGLLQAELPPLSFVALRAPVRP